MALGPRQRETLDEYAGIWKRSPEIIRLEVFIDAYRAYTRELGSGRAILLRAFECYEEGEYKLKGEWIANCHHDDTAVEKAKEIARYLVAAGCLKKRVRIRMKG